MSTNGINMLIVGKTGVGKSSFLNYVFDINDAEVGTGDPVTGRGLHRYDLSLDDKDMTIYDSWGLEADKYQEWQKMLVEELKERSVEVEPAKWFHAVWYCISGGGHRVEPADISIIEQLQKAHYPVAVALTKSDLLNEAEEEAMKDAIRQSFPHINIVPICVGAEGRRGAVNPPFGRDEVKEVIWQQAFAAAIKRLEPYLSSRLDKYVDNWRTQANALIQEVGYVNLDEYSAKLKVLCEKQEKLIHKQLEQDANHLIEVYNEIVDLVMLKSKNSPQTEDVSHWEAGAIAAGAVAVATRFIPVVGWATAGLAAAKWLLFKADENKEALKKTLNEYIKDFESRALAGIKEMSKDIHETAIALGCDPCWFADEGVKKPESIILSDLSDLLRTSIRVGKNPWSI